MYKDKEKQKEAVREANRKYREKQKGITQDRVSRKSITQFEELPADVQRTINNMASSPEDKQARTERAIKYQQMFPSPYAKGADHGPINLPVGYKTADQLRPGEYNHVSKPGDPDYEEDKLPLVVV